jgi:hypothetical protein
MLSTLCQHSNPHTLASLSKERVAVGKRLDALHQALSLILSRDPETGLIGFERSLVQEIVRTNAYCKRINEEMLKKAVRRNSEKVEWLEVPYSFVELAPLVEDWNRLSNYRLRNG